MAKFRRNLLTTNLSGLLGDNFCFRQIKGETVICKRPRKRPGKGTPNQEKARERMTLANEYARTVLDDKEQSKPYLQKAAKNKIFSPHNLAVRDFIRKPTVTDLDIREYSGYPGKEIRIISSDDFMTTEVIVAIYDSFGKLLEQGPAYSISGDIVWGYATTKENLPASGSRVVATAYDLAGNSGILEVIV